MSDNTTPFSNRVSILAELWMNYRDDEDFKDFVEYNDLGLPLAFAIQEGIVGTTVQAEAFVSEAFDLLLAGLGVEDDDYQDLDSLLSVAPEEE